jgi:hypothetical protein
VYAPVSPGTKDHPLFHTSYTGEPDRVVAHTKYGDISAQDFYLWLLMREGPHRAYLLQSFDKARTESDKEAIARAIQGEIDEYVFTNFIIPKIMGNTPCDGVAAIKESIYALPAYQLAYIKSVIEPTLCVLPADRVKYIQEHKQDVLEPERFRTRYIFMASGETDTLEQQDAVEDEMRQLRDDIVAGKLSFSDAAKAHSQAPSASRGGEIPPFKTGELFFFYEDAASTLKPGEVSNVFRGPRGFYMVQLIEAMKPDEPNLLDPAQAAKVEEGLTRQILREAYDWDLRSMLVKSRWPKFRNQVWDLLDECDPVAEVCDFELTKQQFRDAFPEIEGDDLRFRGPLADAWLHTIVERAAMAQEVRALGKENEPYVQRGRWMAANMVRRDGYIDRIRCGLDVNESLVRAFWADNPRLFTPLALKRLIRVTLAPLNTAPLPSQTRDELQRVLVDAGGGAPTVAVVREKLQPEEIGSHNVVQESLQQTEQVFKALEEDAPATTSSQESAPLPQVAASYDSGPTTRTVMIPDLAPLPPPGSVTTTTLVSLRGGGISEPAQGGGCVPLNINVVPPPLEKDPLPGLLEDDDSAELVPPRDLTRPAGFKARVYSAPSAARVIEKQSENWHSPMVLQPGGPDCRPMPRCDVAPAIPPGLELQRAPNENKQLVPPETSNYPFNPDWFYARIDFTKLREMVQSYVSSDFLMKYDDLGYVYVEDIPSIPPGVEAVPAGAFSKPYLVNNSAVAYYVENARTVEKPPFDQIKTQAYATYREVQTDKALNRAYKDEIGSANITYTFQEHGSSKSEK